MGSLSAPAALHPFDPLTADEIALAIELVRSQHGECFFNVASLHEPRKAEMLQWLEDGHVRPRRIANVVVMKQGGSVFDGFVDLQKWSIAKWELLEGVQPIVSVSIPDVIRWY